MTCIKPEVLDQLAEACKESAKSFKALKLAFCKLPTKEHKPKGSKYHK